MEKRKLEDLSDKLQIKINTKGYSYWITAVEEHLKDKSLSKGAPYTRIAKIHSSTYSRVERALRFACLSSQTYIKEYFKINYAVDNSVFLGLLTREMERKNG